MKKYLHKKGIAWSVLGWIILALIIILAIILFSDSVKDWIIEQINEFGRRGLGR